jgi:hypothetical protein
MSLETSTPSNMEQETKKTVKKVVSRTEKYKGYVNRLSQLVNQVLEDRNLTPDTESAIKKEVEKMEKEVNKVKKVKDENAIKKPQADFFYFCKEYRAEHSDQKWTTEKLHDIWKVLTVDDKKKFVDLAAEDKKRYEKEKEERSNKESGSEGSEVESGEKKEGEVKKTTKTKKVKDDKEYKHGEEHPTDKDKIYNKVHDKWVLKTGKVGKAVLEEIKKAMEIIKQNNSE